jgi:hypothetical protein
LIRQLIAATATLLFIGACSYLALPVALAVAQDPPSQDEDKKSAEKEDKKSPFAKDVSNIKEYEIPEDQLKSFFKGSRAHRKQDPALLVEKVLDAIEPSTDELRRFNDLRKQQDIKKDEELALIDKVIRWQVYSLTQPQSAWYQPGSKGRKSRDEIERMLETGSGAAERFLALYKESLLKYLPQLLDNHIWVRVNAMKLLAKAQDERTIKLFCDQMENPDQHESVKFMAMEGLETLGQKKLITQVNLETLAVNTLLDVLSKSNEIHPFTRQQAVRALGAIGRPNRTVGGNDVDVAVALLRIVRDPNIRRADRSEAALLLANLQVPAQADYNYQYIAYELAQFAADVGSAAANDPASDDLHSHLYLVDTSYALVAEKRAERMPLVERAKRNSQASSKADPTYIRTLGDQVTKLTVEAIKVYKPDVTATKTGHTKPAQKASEDVFKRAEEIKKGLQGRFTDELGALEGLIKSRPPRSMKLTPFMEELGPPPALVGPRTTTPGVAEEANGPEAGSDDRPSP